MRNGVRGQIHLLPHIDGVRGTFDLIVANLFASLLRELADTVSGLLSACGLFICSGLLTKDEQQVRCAYEARGFEIRRRFEETDWVTLALARRPPS